ncbi:hypothetical protein VKT23_008297 [Stygiomarasmius scandens]|uniref:Uncharacterized protein n=1 Tax=Marasmiellus scandens TaxID=2682957 RepID=A0ABR1JIP2_9AGAR
MQTGHYNERDSTDRLYEYYYPANPNAPHPPRNINLMAQHITQTWEDEGVFGPKITERVPLPPDPNYILGPSLRLKQYDYDPNHPYFDQPIPQTFTDTFYTLEPCNGSGDSFNWRSVKRTQELPLYGSLKEIEGESLYGTAEELQDESQQQKPPARKKGPPYGNKNWRGGNKANSSSSRGRAVKKEALESALPTDSKKASSSRKKASSASRTSRESTKAGIQQKNHASLKESPLKASYASSHWRT